MSNTDYGSLYGQEIKIILELSYFHWFLLTEESGYCYIFAKQVKNS